MRRFARDRDGAAAMEFAFVLPLLLLFGMGILEFTLAFFDYHRANEATRRGGRTAAILEPIADLSALDNGNSVTCTGSGDSVSCSGGSVENQGTFTAIVTDMQGIYPGIASENVQVVYSPTGIGDIETPGGLKPEVTVSVRNVRHNFIILDALAGIEGIDLPGISASVLANGYSTFGT